MQRAAKVFDRARNTQFLNLDELGEIPSAKCFERVGKEQLLDVLRRSSPRKPKTSNLIRLPFMLDRARHAHFGHAAFGINALDFHRAVNGSLACISHAILKNVEFIRDVCSRCGRTRVCKCNVAYRTSRQRRNRQNKREEKGCDAPLQAGKGHRPPPKPKTFLFNTPLLFRCPCPFPKSCFC